MNTSFKILWFEDEPVWYNMEKIRVEGILREHYLKPDITRKNGDDINITEIIGIDYDLILMDYMLAEETKGDTIVSAMRENSILTDILFYSSEEDSMISALREKIPTVDGVYLTKRSHTIFTEKVQKLIEKIIKRSEDIVNLRGFVMDGSCDFEVRVREILNIAWAKLTEAEKTILEDAAKESVAQIEARDKKTKDKIIKQNPIFPSAVNQPYFLTHSDRLFLLNKVISIFQNNYGLRKDKVINSFKRSYEEDISCYRNALGHKKTHENCIEVKKGTTVPIDEALHQKMRKNLQQYDMLISELEDFVTNRI